MSTTAPYFINSRGVTSNAPLPSDTEVPSLQKINALLVQIAANTAGGSGPSSGLQLTDTVTGQVYTLQIANGVLQWV